MSNIKNIVEQVRATTSTLRSHSREWRESQLKAMKELMTKEQPRIEAAIRADLGRCKTESYLGDISSTIAEVTECLHNLSSWMKPTSLSTSVGNMKGFSATSLQPTPLGLILIISPWNYPINLALAPLAAAIAAGNCVVLKPSELSIECTKLLVELIPKYLDRDCIKVIEGGPAETTELLKFQFDHILYTGSTPVGKIIMRAAAEHLTPVTLELGGKSPVFIDLDHISPAVAARRLMWGKTFNCGQTCIAPDYVMVPRNQQDQLVEALVTELNGFFKGKPQDSSDYGRIINKRHVQRILGLFEDVDPKNIITGGPKEVNEESRYFPPTIIRDVNTKMKIMQDEIFGPVLPIVPVDDVKEAINYVRANPHPLALYIFSNNHDYKQQIINSTTSGSVVVNDCLVQFSQGNIPFGGVGASGMGAYHGKKGFDTFSHLRPVLDKTSHMDFLYDSRYAPYSDGKLNMLKYLV